MPRRKFIVSYEAPYFVTARTRNREWYKLPLPVVWEIFGRQLTLAKLIFELDLIAFVLMINHYHLLVRTPLGNLPQAMNYFQREVSREINSVSHRINQVFGGPYHWSLISGSNHLLTAYKYLYRNPVDAGVCRLAEEYQYSTLRGLLGFSKLIVPLACDDVLFDDVEDRVNWLNTPYPSAERRDLIRKALRKRRFEFGKNKDKQRPNLLILPEKERRT